MTEFATLAAAARAARAMVGCTQDEFAKLMGVSRTTLVAVERGEHDNPMAHVGKLMSASGLDWGEMDQLQRMASRAAGRRDGE